jgi:hypothetical protein
MGLGIYLGDDYIFCWIFIFYQTMSALLTLAQNFVHKNSASD